jgi:hypothetical protein
VGSGGLRRCPTIICPPLGTAGKTFPPAKRQLKFDFVEF